MPRPSSPALVTAVLAALLTGCERPSPQPAPTPTPTPTLSAAKSQNTSIVRPDVEAESAREPALDPLTLRIGFDEGGARLSELAIVRLKEALASEQMKHGGAVTLAGHSDSAGSDAANLRASRQRAEAVRDWLVEHGVAGKRIAIVAFGEQNPVAPNALPDGTPDVAGRAKNRRVDLTITPAHASPAPAPSQDQTLVDQLAEEN